MTHNIFVYGTLRLPAIQQQVIGRQLTAQADQLLGFSCSTITINGSEYLAAESSPVGKINGLLLRNISDEELLLLDDYETAAYKRKQVKLASGFKAWVYTRA
jgi:gamma-glutamylcyclotransferase (GGCT)/AIG2-like uncharacterized protein YtfP